ncbi:DNA adenine methylase [Pasteurella multocida]|uniref:DNA adenine methylase n=1 Tax=Pasteurella multocida TaxID=747 RepID=UPI00099D4F31|nr:DNA adenine methylase [Pasteurella multocida]MCL7766818.1 DNA adenine methylase [Pasteurella multocida]MCL7824995.1 DNA adenine methylase [Pasteurella multocida]MCL7829376.1 DNA adenine methylase [Pasteurella multocida]MCL7833729.1 DNA adenine methylase [Pasteurella multocida]OPC86241.1 DNA adenine methylase [Pasteurella multocida subsp. multocida]
MIKSPLNYMGGKYKLLPQILPLFPQQIRTFFDVFAGGCNVGINVNASKVILNDNLTYLIDLYKFIKNNDKQDIISYIENRILELNLSQSNLDGYLKLREQYNLKKEPLDLFVLAAFSFSHQIRFNNKHQFNTPFGRDRSSFNPVMKENLLSFIECLKKDNVELFNLSFEQLNYDELNEYDLVYCDPPYLITTGTYNDGKRGFKGWSEIEEKQLLSLLDSLNNKGIKFALSNVLEHKGNINHLLSQWVVKNNYNLHYLNFSYSNSSYNTRKNGSFESKEVLITNY